MSLRLDRDKSLIIAVLITIVIFTLDLLLPLWYQIWVIYLIPLFLMFKSAKRPYVFSVIITLLVATRLFLSPSDNTSLMHAAANRVTGMLGGWGVSVLLMQFRRLNTSLLQARNDLEKRVEDRTAELSEANRSLKKEINERIKAEDEVRMLNEELDHRVKQRTEELDAANMELEAFTYSVSHDLRAPLRHMTGFAKMLEERLVDHDDEKTHKYIASIITASKKMGMLIDDLLSFSHIGRAELQMREVSLNALLKEVIQETQDELQGRQIAWEIDEMPDVLGDQSLLRLVIVNLVSNSVKFTSTRPQAEIKIGCQDHGDHFTCSIADNGVGFDMKHADKLFGVFQRLHTQKEFEGTGIGLANAKRIISRHGGRIWAQSEVGQGATFFFTLPKR